MQDAKPWYASQAIWGGFASVGAGLGGAFYAFQTKDMSGALIAIVGAAGGFHAIVGRVKADTTIGKALHQADDAITALVHKEPTP